MNNSESFGTCPLCLASFNIKDAMPSFANKFPGNQIMFIYGLCPNCFNDYSKCSKQSQAKLRVQARTNFFNNPSKDWSLIDSLSFRVRNENFFNAWYFGSGLPSIVVEAINKGLIDNISILPSMVEVSHE